MKPHLADGWVDLKGLAAYLEEIWIKSAKARKKQQYFKGEPPLDVEHYHKISVCTTVMGRLKDLQETLPKNIEDNLDYPNVEHVILDYNSQDGLEDWIKANYMQEIDDGRMLYARTDQPQT